MKAYKSGTVFNGHAANKYYRKDVYDPETGELFEKAKYLRYLDKDLIDKDEKLDDYYLIETNVVGTCEDERPWQGKARFRDYDCLFELNRPVSDLDIIDMYCGLWKIEKSFKITKSYLESRLVFVRKQTSIQAHFLTCFIALFIIWILETKKLGETVPYSQIIKVLVGGKNRRGAEPHIQELLHLAPAKDNRLPVRAGSCKEVLYEVGTEVDEQQYKA